MLYTNINLFATDVKREWGTLHQVEIGEYGRGRKLITLPCPEKITKIPKGLHTDLTIGMTRSQRPRINEGIDDKMFLILSSKGGYTRRGDGIIFAKKGQADKFRILAKGNGADGDAGRIGFWDCMVLEVLDATSDILVRVQISGRGYGIPNELIWLKPFSAQSFTLDTYLEFCDCYGLDVPFQYKDDMFFSSDWEQL